MHIVHHTRQASSGLRDPSEVVLRHAEIDASGTYRYRLTRTWAPDYDGVCWIMLNPSTADAVSDDPTLRRVIDFSRRWGFGSVTVVNLFALRATSPAALRHADDPVGRDNDGHIRAAVRECAVTVAAWGCHGVLQARDCAVATLLTDLGRSAVCLGPTRAGHPRHPLYVQASAPFVPFVYGAA